MRVLSRFAVAAAAVLAFTAVNLTYRLDSESITEWDESLYALSAWEMLQTGDWISTRHLGRIDYYNAKPPLNVWLIALSFKAFGASAATLRLTSVASGWLTVAVLMLWSRRRFGDATALLAGIILSTCFAFIYVHAARTANTDALFTLLMLLVVVTVDTAADRPWRRVWLGPILALVFLLRGTAVLMPLALIIGITWSHPPAKARTWWPAGAAWLGFLIPTLGWAIARWRVDEWRFFEKLWSYDLISRSFVALEGHAGGPFFYLDVLQKYQYDWLIAGAGALLLARPSLAAVRGGLASTRTNRHAALIAWWAGLTLIIPTAMQTKASWYLDPLYPVFALLVALLIVRAWTACAADSRMWRRAALVGTVVVACAVAEGRLLWHSLHNRAMHDSVQELLHLERSAVAARAVYRDRWPHPDRFVLIAMAGGEPRLARSVDDFLAASGPADCLIAPPALADARLEQLRTVGSYALYRRR